MKLYRLTKPGNVGPGTIVSLDPDQMATRDHRVRRIEKTGTGKDQRTTVITDELLQFKATEILGFPDELPKNLTPIAEEAGDAADGKRPAGKRDDRLTRIIQAIGRLDPQSRKHFRTDGLPAVAALEAAVGFKISAAERDEAWRRATKS